MKSMIFATYSLSVLMFSGFARADLAMPFSTFADKQDSEVEVEYVRPDNVNLELVIGGFLPTPCNEEPKATLEQDFNSPGVIILRLSSPSPSSTACIYKREGFETTVSLPVVAQSSVLNLEDKAVYVIKLEGYPFEMQVLGSDLMRVPGFIMQ